MPPQAKDESKQKTIIHCYIMFGSGPEQTQAVKGSHWIVLSILCDECWIKTLTRQFSRRSGSRCSVATRRRSRAVSSAAHTRRSCWRRARTRSSSSGTSSRARACEHSRTVMTWTSPKRGPAPTADSLYRNFILDYMYVISTSLGSVKYNMIVLLECIGTCMIKPVHELLPAR